MNDQKWICADGRQISVYELDDSHLNNIINKMRRTGWQWKQEWAQRLLTEQQNRSAAHHGTK